MSDQFYVILPSNSSMDLYPQNKISNFKVHLPQAIKLDITKWEAALAEIQFPNTWYNVKLGKNKLIKEYTNLTTEELNIIFPLNEDKDKKNEIEKRNFFFESSKKDIQISYKQELTIPAGYYSDVRVIITMLKNIEKQQPRQTQYIYNPITTKTHVKLQKNCKLNFNNSDIATCLGFQLNSIIQNTHISFGLSTVKKYNNMYVYSNVVRNQSTGNIKAPLLRVIPIQNKYGEYACIQYDRPHFLPVSSSIIDNIEINIKDDAGEYISFEGGTLILTLVFRRKKSSFFN